MEEATDMHARMRKKISRTRRNFFSRYTYFYKFGIVYTKLDSKEPRKVRAYMCKLMIE